MSELKTSTIPSIRLAGSQIMPIAANGTVKISDVTSEIKSISNVLYVPGIHTNLLSVGRFTDLGYLVTFTSTRCYIYDKNNHAKIYLRATRDTRNKLYRIESNSTHLSLAEGAIPGMANSQPH
jgi:hypothetical protein